MGPHTRYVWAWGVDAGSIPAVAVAVLPPMTKCHIRQCDGETDGKLCDACLAKMRRQEPKAETVMDGNGPRGW